jgi:methylmalonyl-CoA epimerase
LITGASFIGILVKDLEEAARFYIDMLGLEPWEQGTLDMPGARALLLHAGNCYIELLQPMEGSEEPVGGNLARRLEKYGEGVCRLGLWAHELDEEIQRLHEHGIQVIDPGGYGDIAQGMGTKMAFVHPKTAHGVLVELDQQT